jgi:aspartokinase/homoserine dehydrogenase 1
MNILKFGGTSVANSSSLQSVIEIVKSQQQESVVVVSALGGITNLLIDFLYRASQNDDTGTY